MAVGNLGGSGGESGACCHWLRHTAPRAASEKRELQREPSGRNQVRVEEAVEMEVEEMERIVVQREAIGKKSGKGRGRSS